MAGTWKRYSNNAIPQLTNAATYHWRPFRFLRWAYHANVMNTLDNASNSVVCKITCIHGPLSRSENPPIPPLSKGDLKLPAASCGESSMRDEENHDPTRPNPAPRGGECGRCTFISPPDDHF